MEPIVITKGRTKTISVGLGYDVSNDTLTSEIHEEKDSESELIATWAIAFLTDGIDGELVLVLDDSSSVNVEKSSGWMDIKRVTGGEPVDVFDEPLEVSFRSPVTA